MTLQEIVAKAKYIQFPYNNETYKEIYGERNPERLPILPGEDVLYKGMPRDNGHHYTTDYAYRYVLPLIDSLLNFGFSVGDFEKVSVCNGVYDLSYLNPKEADRFSVECFDDGVCVEGGYDVLFDPSFFENPLYRELYRFPHRCSRIVNLGGGNGRRLMVSGDSQMIPSIAPLAHYFGEVWYFDNRTGYRKDADGKYEFDGKKFRSFGGKYSYLHFTDSLIECYCRCLEWYEYWNLQ